MASVFSVRKKHLPVRKKHLSPEGGNPVGRRAPGKMAAWGCPMCVLAPVFSGLASSNVRVAAGLAPCFHSGTPKNLGQNTNWAPQARPGRPDSLALDSEIKSENGKCFFRTGPKETLTGPKKALDPWPARILNLACRQIQKLNQKMASVSFGPVQKSRFICKMCGAPQEK